MNEAVMSAPLVQVDIGLFADKVGVTTAHTLDLRQGVHDLALAINVRVEETQNVLHSESISLHPLYTIMLLTDLELLVGLGDVERHGVGGD